MAGGAWVGEIPAGRFTVRLTARGADAAAVDAAIAEYLERYPPQGYATAFGTPSPEEGGGFVAYGHRSRSAGG